MNKKYKKIALTLFACVILIIGVFVLVTVAEKLTKEADTETKVTKDSTNSNSSSTSNEKEAAEELIDKTVSRDKVKENVGKWDKFEMSSKGCERGVYAGKFYYEEFTIFSRTYDKGKTFRIISVN